MAAVAGLDLGHETVLDLSGLAGHRYVHLVESRQPARLCVPPHKEYTVVSPGTKTAIFKAHEELDLCCRQCGCLWRRDFDLRVENGQGAPAYYFYHNFMCCEWCHCCSICNHRMTIYEANPNNRKEKGNIVGYVQSDFKCGFNCIPNFTIKNGDGKEYWTIRKDGECDGCFCCGCNLCKCCSKPGTGYVISDGSGQVGGIHHLFEDRSKQMEEDQFRIHFPERAKELDRILMIASAILLDYDIYDEPPKEEKMIQGDKPRSDEPPKTSPPPAAGGHGPPAHS